MLRSIRHVQFLGKETIKSFNTLLVTKVSPWFWKHVTDHWSQYLFKNLVNWGEVDNNTRQKYLLSCKNTG